MLTQFIVVPVVRNLLTSVPQNLFAVFSSKENKWVKFDRKKLLVNRFGFRSFKFVL